MYLSLISVAASIYLTDALLRNTYEEPHGFDFVTGHCDIIRITSEMAEGKSELQEKWTLKKLSGRFHLFD